MKFSLIRNAFFSVLFSTLALSCITKALPTVKKPTYKTYNYGSEKGYIAEFQVSESKAKPIAIVINRVKQTITPDSKTGNQYKINIIAQSNKIFGFKPQIIDSENGIFFKTDSTEQFKKVNFQSK